MKARRGAAIVAATVLVGAGLAVTSAGTALAGHCDGTVHRVTITGHLAPNLFGPGTGGGMSFSIDLCGTSSGGTGVYTGSDSLHHTPLGPTRATHDSGGVTWTSDGTTITIVGVTLGGGIPVTLTVPESGHESTDLASVFSPPVGTLPGSSEVQVSP